MTAKNLTPVETLVSVLIDIVKDGITVKESGQPLLAELSQFANLAADLPAAVGAIAGLPGSLDGFAPADAEALVAFAISKGAVSNAHAQAIVNAALQVGVDLYALVTAIKTPPAAPAAS